MNGENKMNPEMINEFEVNNVEINLDGMQFVDVVKINNPSQPYSKSIISNFFIMLFMLTLTIIIGSLVINSLIDFLIKVFSRNEEKKRQSTKHIKSMAKNIALFLLPMLIILISIFVFDLRINYMISGMGEKIYKSSDFNRIAYYGIFVVALSTVLLIGGIIRLVKRRNSNKKSNITFILLFAILAILYSCQVVEILC